MPHSGCRKPRGSLRGTTSTTAHSGTGTVGIYLAARSATLTPEPPCARYRTAVLRPCFGKGTALGMRHRQTAYAPSLRMQRNSGRVRPARSGDWLLAARAHRNREHKKWICSGRWPTKATRPELSRGAGRIMPEGWSELECQATIATTLCLRSDQYRPLPAKSSTTRRLFAGSGIAPLVQRRPRPSA